MSVEQRGGPCGDAKRAWGQMAKHPCAPVEAPAVRRSEVEPRGLSSAVPGAAFRSELPLQLLVENKPQGLGGRLGCAITGHQAPRVGAGWK